MKKSIAVLLCLMLLPVFFASANAAGGTAYYIDALNGSDGTGDGLTPATAWRSVTRFSEVTLQAGDRVLFRRGGAYDCNLTFTDCAGTPEAPILISAYGDGEKPLLTTEKNAEVLRLFDCSYFTVEDLEITAHNGGGIWIDALKGESAGITLRDLKIHDIQNHPVDARDGLYAGAAVARACVMVKGLPARTLYPVNGLTVENCEMYDCGNGISLWGAYDQTKGSPWNGDEFSELAPVYNEDALISGCYFHDMDAEAVILGICKNALMTRCRVIDCCRGEGVDENGRVLYYTAAAWFWGSEYSTIEYCEIAGQRNVGDGMTVDFDSQTNHCTYQYIYSHDNVRFMCNNAKTSPQVGNTVRYCLSVNDDRGRNKIASGPGERGMRFYNNTIVGSQRFDFDGLYDSYFVNNVIVMKEGYRLNTDLRTAIANGNVLRANCYDGCLAGPLAGAAYNRDPCFAGTDPTAPDSFRLSDRSPLIGQGVPMDPPDTVDFYGAPVEKAGIGCDCSTGVAGNTRVFAPLTRLRLLLRRLIALVKNEVQDLFADR